MTPRVMKAIIKRIINDIVGSKRGEEEEEGYRIRVNGEMRDGDMIKKKEKRKKERRPVAGEELTSGGKEGKKMET